MAKKEVKSLLRDVSQDEKPKTTPETLLDQMKIDELTLLRMTRYMEKERAARMELQLAGATLNGLFQQWLKENSQAKEMNEKIANLQAEQKSAQEAYAKLVAKVGSEFKIDMAEYAFDDETGVLHPLPSKPTPADK